MSVSKSRFANVWSHINTNSNFHHPLELVGRGSETHHLERVGANLNQIT